MIYSYTCVEKELKFFGKAMLFLNCFSKINNVFVVFVLKYPFYFHACVACSKAELEDMIDTAIFLSKCCRFENLNKIQNTPFIGSRLCTSIYFGVESFFLFESSMSIEMARKHRISWILICAHVVLMNVFIYCLTQTFHTVEWPCFNVNDCVVWLISWNHITVATLIQLSALFHRRKKMSRCLDEAEGLTSLCARKQKESRTKLLHYFICLVLILLIKTISILHTRQAHEIFILVFYSVTLVTPFSMECMVMLLTSVAENVCDEINTALAKLSGKKENEFELARDLKNLMSQHQNTANFLKTISCCYSKDLLVDLAFNMIWFIICIYVTTVALCTNQHKSSKKVSLILDFIFLTTRVCYMSLWVNRIEEKVGTVVKILSFVNNFKLKVVP